MAGKTSIAPRPSTAPAASRTTPADAADAVSLQPAARPADTGADAIRARAFFLWEQAGRPDGDGVEFWVRAEQELVSPR